MISPAGTSLLVPAILGPGEAQSILLAVEQRATWLLVDDLDARRAALANLEAAGAETNLKGTLGVVLAAREHGHLSREEATTLVHSLRQRPDVWIGAALYERVLDLLQRG